MSRDPAILERVQASDREHEESEHERDVAIRTAWADGWSYREIARVCGLSYQTVARIVREK